MGPRRPASGSLLHVLSRANRVLDFLGVVWGAAGDLLVICWTRASSSWRADQCVSSPVLFLVIAAWARDVWKPSALANVWQTKTEYDMVDGAKVISSGRCHPVHGRPCTTQHRRTIKNTCPRNSEEETMPHSRPAGPPPGNRQKKNAPFAPQLSHRAPPNHDYPANWPPHDEAVIGNSLGQRTADRPSES